MQWQDAVLTACNVVFAYALVPQLVEGFRRRVGGVTIQTAALTTLALATIAACYFTLTLPFAGVLTTLAALCWAGLLVQRLAYGPPEGTRGS